MSKVVALVLFISALPLAIDGGPTRVLFRLRHLRVTLNRLLSERIGNDPLRWPIWNSSTVVPNVSLAFALEPHEPPRLKAQFQPLVLQPDLRQNMTSRWRFELSSWQLVFDSIISGADSDAVLEFLIATSPPANEAHFGVAIRIRFGDSSDSSEWVSICNLRLDLTHVPLRRFTWRAERESAYKWSPVSWSQPSCEEASAKTYGEPEPPRWIAQLRAELLHMCASERVFGASCDQCELLTSAEMPATQRVSESASGAVTLGKVAACGSICSPDAWFNGYQCVSARLSVRVVRYAIIVYVYGLPKFITPIFLTVYRLQR